MAAETDDAVPHRARHREPLRGGLRVTTPETLDAVLKVFAGSVNHELVSSLNRAGALAVGLSGIDAFLVEAEQMDPALGGVGRVTNRTPRCYNCSPPTAICRW